MAEISSAFLSILPSAKGFGSKLEREVGGESRGVGKRIGLGFGRAFAAGGALLAAAGVGSFLKGSLDEAREAQKVGAQTNAVIKSTGGVANVTAKSIGNLSTAISNKVGIDDEAIQSGGNLLLTFTNIRNEAGKGNKIFDETVQAATDMSVALGTDVKSASLQLGKALNDPTKGFSRLQRSGVSFTDSQVKQIAALQKSGNLLGAQKIILGEVRKEFGGSAAAQVTAGDKAKVAYANLQEALGTLLLPTLDKVLTGLTKVATYLTANLGPAFSQIRSFVAPVFAAIRSSLVPAVAQLRSFFAGFDAAESAGRGLSVLRDISASFQTGVLPALRQIGTTLSSTVLPTITKVGNSIATNFAPVLATAARIVGTEIIPALARLASITATRLAPIFAQIGGIIANQVVPTIAGLARSITTNFAPVLLTIARVVGTQILPALGKLAAYIATRVAPILAQVGGIISRQVVPILASLARFVIGQVVPAVMKIVTAIATHLKPVFDQLFQSVQTQILPAVQRLLVKFREYQPTIQRIILVVLKVIGAVLKFAAIILGAVLPVVIRFAAFLIGKLLGAFGFVIGFAVRLISAVIRIGTVFVNAVKFVAKFQIGIIQHVAAAVKYVAGIPGKILKALGNLGNLLKGAGASIIEGLVNGLKSAAGKVTSIVKGIIDKIPKAVRKIMGIASPSKVMHQLGRYTGEGFTLGLESSLSGADAIVGGLTSKVASATAGASSAAGSGRQAITITNWADGTGYFEVLSENRTYGILQTEGVV